MKHPGLGIIFYALVALNLFLVCTPDVHANFKVKVEPDADGCFFRLMLCMPNERADREMRELERATGWRGPPGGVLWCSCLVKVDGIDPGPDEI